MAGFREAIIAGAREAVCTVLEPAGNAASLFSDVVEEIPIVGGPLALPSATFSNAAGLVCDSAPTPNQLDPNTTQETGQCPTTYRTRVIYTRFVGGVEETVNDLDNNTYLGPVSETIITPTNPDNAVTTTFTVEVTFASGTFTIVSNPFTDTGTTATVQSVTFERTDGQPDDCGAIIPPPILPENERTIGDTINVDGVDIDVDFRVGSPTINLNGDINIPISVTGPNFNFDLALNLGDNEVNFNFGGGGKGGECCPEVPEDESADKIIRGVRVFGESVTLGRYIQHIPTQNPPTVYGPWAGLVRFTRQVDGVTYYSEDLRVKTFPQDIPCPWPSGASGFVVDKQKGVDFTAQAYFASIREQPSEQ